MKYFLSLSYTPRFKSKVSNINFELRGFFWNFFSNVIKCTFYVDHIWYDFNYYLKKKDLMECYWNNNNRRNQMCVFGLNNNLYSHNIWTYMRREHVTNYNILRSTDKKFLQIVWFLIQQKLKSLFFNFFKSLIDRKKKQEENWNFHTHKLDTFLAESEPEQWVQVVRLGASGTASGDILIEVITVIFYKKKHFYKMQHIF